MKRFLGILVCLLALASCDDGDLIVDTIDFSAVTTSSCPDNNLIFKLKESEALILNIPEETFVNDPTDPNAPIKLDIGSANQVVYNFYNGKVVADNLCALIPPAIPSINKQWFASSGVIEITTTAVKKLDETNNSTRITGYNHNIIFKNITFKKEDNTTQFYETFPFGDYLKNIDPLPFNFSELLQICSNNGQVYVFSESASFTLDIDPALIANEVTPINSPRVGTIGPVKNKLAYRLFNSVLRSDYFCQPTTPILPTIKEEWFGRTGGTVEVTTTTSGPNTFKHTIVFKNVTLEKDNSNFQLGNNYKYGELQTIK
ncbi:hypothetical protein [Flavobacterium gilvum]|uniref:Lipoprotein n=1 Tax=Flavobacterium gilvum TaxID=1492737 RepID=A0AAC9I4L7_9FLAO|nr:hypothetical protein [Flavobacterium gilvum]AOW10764.1 hypothetical protein EM308_15390 [Flavobacterium gilvum]KFC58724.1 hypothetical protein FEM08_24570 [Flavobacterium gilvum]